MKSYRRPIGIICGVLLLLACTAAVSASGFLPAWSTETADNTWAASGSTIVDSAGVCHIVFFTDASGTGRWLTRLGPNSWINPLTGQPWPGGTPSDNIVGIRPSVAVDANRNVYIAYEQTWAGQVMLVRYNYVGNNRWVLDGSPVQIPSEMGYWPTIKISNGIIAVGVDGRHDATQNYPPAISINATGNYRSGWNTNVAWTMRRDYTLDASGNIHVLENGDNSNLDPYAYLYKDYNYRVYSPTFQLLAGPYRVTDTGGDGWRTGNRIFAHWIALNGTTAYMVFRIIDNYRNPGPLDSNNIWMWTCTSGVVTGPVNCSQLPNGWVTDDCNCQSNNGTVVVTYVAGSDPNTCSAYAWDVIRDLRSGPMDTGIRNTNLMTAVDSHGSIYVNTRETGVGANGRCQFGFIHGAEGLGTFAGTVRDGIGTALGAANILVTGPNGYNLTVSTAPNGTYSLGGLYPGSYSMTASKLGYLSDTHNNVVAVGDQTTTTDFTLPISQGTISGHVLDAKGAAVSGATVTAVGPGTYPVNTAANGSYTLSGVATGTYTVTASKFGYLKHAQSATLSTNAQAITRDFVIRIATARDIAQMPDAIPAEATAKVISAIFSDDGYIYVQDPARTSGIRVVSSGSGLSVGQSVNVSGGVSTVMQNGYGAERRIGTPTSPATVTYAASGSAPKPLAMTSLAVGGAAVSPNVPGVKDASGLNNIGLLVKIAGKVTLTIGNYVFVDDGSNIDNGDGSVGVMVESPSAPTVTAGNIVSATGIVQGSIPSGWTESRRYIKLRASGDLALISSNIGTISGYVTDSEWTGIAGAVVSTTSGGYSTTTSGSGAYTLAAVVAGNYTVEAGKVGYTTASQDITLAADQNLSLDLIIDPNVGSIQGLVRDSHSVAVSGATVTTSTGGYTATTNSSGGYTISGVAAGTYSVTASKVGYASQTLAGKSVNPGAATYANFALTATSGTIAGTVRDSNSALISGASVSTSTGGYTATTNASGAYTLSNVTAGTYSVTASKTGYSPQTQAGIVAAAGSTTTCNLVLTSTTGTISGTVTAGGGGAISGAAVSTTTGGYAATTNSSGGYTISGVTPGTYSVVASASGYISHTNAGVVVTAGNATASNFALVLNSGTISGTVTASGGGSLSGATVSTTSGGYSTTTNASGGYTLSGIITGTYSVTASKSGYTPQTNTGVAVAAGNTTISNFTLPIILTEKVRYGTMETFFSTLWDSTCSTLPSVLAGLSASDWGWNNDGSYPFNTFDSTIKHGGSHALGFAFCQTAATPGKMGIAFQSVNLGSAGATATFSAWGYHANGNCPSIMAWNPGSGQNSPYTAQSAGRSQFISTDTFGQVNTWVTNSMAVTADSSGWVTIMVGGSAYTGTPSGTRLYVDDVSVL